ncbi:metallophosphoesterase [uncultured Desulfobacter sp.]|uniref:metallophosphoesterase family protein n=1 Tax=uncultured Desulfobacter sp. TaxID=240139 RepID=UPI002AAADB1B|nr:metallophosphoesterase [uncultured Desulfobacter sp.]
MFHLQRIGLLGDVHCQCQLLDVIVSFLNSRHLLILCTGDIVDGAGDPNKCIELLQSNNILTVLGNHDRWLLDNEMRSLPDTTDFTELTTNSVEFLNSLPITLEFSTPSGIALLCHGLGENNMAKLGPDIMVMALSSIWIFRGYRDKIILSLSSMVTPIEEW